MECAKTRVGQAITAGFGARARKEFGDTSQMARVESGIGVPDYLARIHADPAARRRFGVEWFEGDPDVEIDTTIRIRTGRRLPAKAAKMAGMKLAADEEQE